MFLQVSFIKTPAVKEKGKFCSAAAKEGAMAGLAPCNGHHVHPWDCGSNFCASSLVSVNVLVRGSWGERDRKGRQIRRQENCARCGIHLKPSSMLFP